MGSFSDDLYNNHLLPLQWAESQNGFALRMYCDSIGGMFQIVEDLSRDGVDNSGKNAPGWSQLMDLPRCPTYALQWLAQFIGVLLPIGLTDAQQRAYIAAAPGWKRGTPAAIIAAAQTHLTGNKLVTLRERSPDAYSFDIHTLTSETPNSAQTLADILAQKPAGINMTYSTWTGQDYQTIYSGNASYSPLFTGFLTYQGIVNNAPGT